jgi:hypothetical protein
VLIACLEWLTRGRKSCAGRMTEVVENVGVRGAVQRLRLDHHLPRLYVGVLFYRSHGHVIFRSRTVNLTIILVPAGRGTDTARRCLSCSASRTGYEIESMSDADTTVRNPLHFHPLGSYRAGH